MLVRHRKGLGEAEAFEAQQAAFAQQQQYIAQGIVLPITIDDVAMAQTIASALAKAFSYTAPTVIPVPDPRARIKQQLLMMNKLLHRSFNLDPRLDDYIADDIAGKLLASGTVNLLDIAEYRNDSIGLAFWYDKRTGKVLALNNVKQGGDAVDHFSDSPTGESVAGDRIKFRYYLKITPDGYPVFIATPPIDVGSGWVDFRTIAVFVAATAITSAFPGLGEAIGSAVMGPSLAATYPAIATGIGNAAVATAMNGGDIQKGVVSALAGGLGSSAGSLTQTITDSNIIGNVAAAATRAAITGGDLTQAVGMSLASAGVSNMANLFSSQSLGDYGGDDYVDPALFADDTSSGYADVDAEFYGPDVNLDAIDWNAVDWNTVDWGAVDAGDFSSLAPVDASTPVSLPSTGASNMGDYFTDENGVQYGYDPDGDVQVIDFVDEQGVAYYTDPQGDLMVLDSSPTNLGTVAYDPGAMNNPPVSPSGTVSTDSGVNLTNLALTALKLVGAWNQAGQPAIRTSSATSTANANGTVTTRNANGTVSTTRMPVGTPYVTANGSIVTNNGDGTYSSVSSNGVTTTGRYAGSATSGTGALGNIPPAVLYGGIALIAVLALKK